MRLITLRSVAFVAVASIAVLFGSAQSDEGWRRQEVDHKNADFKTDNHGHEAHHKKPHKKAPQNGIVSYFLVISYC